MTMSDKPVDRESKAACIARAMEYEAAAEKLSGLAEMTAQAWATRWRCMAASATRR